MIKTLFCLSQGILFFMQTFAQGPRPIRDTRPLARPPQLIAADKSKVMDYFQNQQFEEAISYLAPALGDDSANASVLGFLGYAYYMTDNARAAENCYERIFDLDSNNISAIHYLEVLNSHEDPEKALGFATRLADLQPGKSPWWRMKGELLRRLKQPDSAFSCLSRAYTLMPSDAKNSAAFAELLIERKSYPLADSILDVALAEDSLNFPLLKLRMRSAYLIRDYTSVLPLGERSMRLHLPDLNAQSWLALSYYNLKQYPDCIRACEFLLNNGYDAESIYYYESRALSKLGQFSESNALLGVCLKKAISNTADWYYNDLGDNYEGLKNFKMSLAAYDTAFYLFKEPIMLYNCGRIAETGLKNNALARKYYTRYLALAHPETPEEKKVYVYVKTRWNKKRK